MCDVALGAVAAAHCRSTAAATALLCSRPSSSFAAESKDKGKATTAPPVDYIGLTTDGSGLLFCASGTPTAASHSQCSTWGSRDATYLRCACPPCCHRC